MRINQFVLANEHSKGIGGGEMHRGGREGEEWRDDWSVSMLIRCLVSSRLLPLFLLFLAFAA
jgi:hypothetical protein